MSLETQILNQLKKIAQNNEVIVSKRMFEDKYYGKMTKDEWYKFKKSFPECVKQKPGSNSVTINVSLWQQQHKSVA